MNTVEVKLWNTKNTSGHEPGPELKECS